MRAFPTRPSPCHDGEPGVPAAAGYDRSGFQGNEAKPVLTRRSRRVENTSFWSSLGRQRPPSAGAPLAVPPYPLRSLT